MPLGSCDRSLRAISALGKGGDLDVMPLKMKIAVRSRMAGSSNFREEGKLNML